MAETTPKVEANSGGRFAPGKAKTAGRQKGTPNKLTRAFRDAVQTVYGAIGGDAAFARWAKKNPTEYYKIAARLIPSEVQQLGKDGKPVDPVAAPTISVTVGALPVEPKKGNGHA